MELTNRQTGDMESHVHQRYAAAAHVAERGLCCPTQYDSRLLAALPEEVLERDYGCGDPSRHLHPGETVLDLGSGAGKICFMAAQIVGAAGRVIGIDMNDDMLAVARRNAPEVAQRIGYGNVEFRKGRIQDLELDLERVEEELRQSPIASLPDLNRFAQRQAELRQAHPLVARDSIDVVVSNCVLNLVAQEDKTQLFREIFRVLRRGGRAVISDIVSDEEVPPHLQANAELWSGCISGALREDAFLHSFEAAGFHGITMLERQAEPWRTVEGIEFRSVTVVAFKGKQGPCLERGQAVIYKGPFRQVEDDDGHVLRRGDRVAVCDKTFRLYGQEPYRDHFERIAPLVEIPLDEAAPFTCTGTRRRDPRETKGQDYRATTEVRNGCCGPEGSC